MEIDKDWIKEIKEDEYQSRFNYEYQIVYKEGREIGAKISKLESINNFILKLNYTLDQALDLLDISTEEYEELYKEVFLYVIKISKETLNIKIQEQIVKYDYNKLGEHDVIEVYIKKGTDVMDMASILANLEEIAEKLGLRVLVDFLRAWYSI